MFGSEIQALFKLFNPIISSKVFIAPFSPYIHIHIVAETTMDNALGVNNIVLKIASLPVLIIK